MKKSILFSIIISLFALAGCEKMPIEQNSITRRLNDSTILVALHETFTDVDFSLRYDSLLEYSRCPEGVMCVWEGNARVKLTLIQNGENYTFTLNTSLGFPKDTIINNLRYELVSVAPYPKYVSNGINAGVVYDGNWAVEVKITAVSEIDFNDFIPSCCEWIDCVKYSVVKIDSYNDYTKYVGNYDPLCDAISVDFENKTVLLSCGEMIGDIVNISKKLVKENNRYSLELDFTLKPQIIENSWKISIITDKLPVDSKVRLVVKRTI